MKNDKNLKESKSHMKNDKNLKESKSHMKNDKNLKESKSTTTVESKIYLKNENGDILIKKTERSSVVAIQHD